MSDPKKPFSTAEQLRSRLIVVTLPADDANEEIRVACRRPDPVALFSSALLPLKVYAAVAEKAVGSIQDWAKAAAEDQGLYGDFIDRWVCAAAVNPTVVINTDSAGVDAVWVEDLPVALRVAIYAKTNDRLSSKRTIDAVAEFRCHERLDPDPGSGGTAVRDTAVEPLVGA